MPDAPDLARFARALYAERAGWDGGDLQDLGVRYGVLVPESRTAPCAEEGCACADVCGPEDAPWTCYRLHPSLWPTDAPDLAVLRNAEFNARADLLHANHAYWCDDSYKNLNEMERALDAYRAAVEARVRAEGA